MVCVCQGASGEDCFMALILTGTAESSAAEGRIHGCKMLNNCVKCIGRGILLVIWKTD